MKPERTKSILLFVPGMSLSAAGFADSAKKCLVLLAGITLCFAMSARAVSLSLDKSVYTSGEDITVTWSGGPGNPTDRIAFYSPCRAPVDGTRHGPVELWQRVSGANGRIAFTNSLAIDDYVAVFLVNDRLGQVGNTVAFSVGSGIDKGGDILDFKRIIGPCDVPGAYAFADPAVIKEGNSWFITGTYTIGRPPHYMVETSDWEKKTLHTLSIDMNTAYLRTYFGDATFWTNNLWGFTPYKHTDGSWHAYGAFMHRSTWTTSVAHFRSLDAKWPVTNWRLDKVLVDSGYDTKMYSDASGLYLLYVGNGIMAQKMLDPENIDPSFTARSIIAPEGLNSEYRNGTSGMQLIEGQSIAYITDAGKSKYVMFYNVGDFAASNYKLGVAYSDVLIPPAGRYYTKVRAVDRPNLWGNGAGVNEVAYLFQTQIPNWHNYFGKYLNAPGLGTLIEYNGNYYTVFHGYRPAQPAGAAGKLGGSRNGRWVYMAPVNIDFSKPDTNMNKWILPAVSNGLSLAKQSNLTAVYDDSGRKLGHVQRYDTGEKLSIGRPLWLVVTEEDGVISSTDFSPLDAKNKPRSFKHKKSGLICSVTSRAEGNFIRHFYTLEATKPVAVKKFAALAVPPEFESAGSVPGSPLVSGNWFAGMEYPMALTVDKLESQIGGWELSMLEPRVFKELRYSLPDKPIKTGNSVNIQFTYQSGWSRLDIRRVALMKGDKLIAEDIHDGFAGTPSRLNTYTLDLSSLGQSQRAGLRIIADVMLQGDSRGIINVQGGKVELVTQYADCKRELKAGESMKYSSVIGHGVSGSLRRGVLEYIEASRARKYKPFLHYNSWYDIADQGSDGLHVMDSDQCLGVMKAWDRDFMKPYGIKMDCFVFDDGWDDFDNLWSFHPERFPEGFGPQARLAKKLDTHIGTWFSPFGGYGDTKAARLKAAREAGYEINSSGLSLSGKKYYKLFYDKSAEMINKYEVNSFKYDGVGGGPSADMEAAYRLMAELRQIKPDLYINLTTGTWGSPFFLLHGDSIWRGGGDAHVWGDKGPMTHRWLNYRDGETYNNIVKQNRLFPLNSLMLCGMVYSRLGLGRTSVDKTDKSFADQAYSFFATGTQLQELYMSHAVMTKKKWDILADAVKWSHANTATLRDTHWVGGDPYKYEVYGHASFDYRGLQKDQPYKAIVCLRNPAEKTVDFQLPLTAVTEWAADKVSGWKISRRVYGEAKATADGNSLKVQIPPFSVVLLELSVMP